MSLNDDDRKQISNQIKMNRKKHTKSKKTALKALQAIGYLDKNGKIKYPYNVK